ncbi:hypothetical protein IKG05_01685 [Candidatus Saccharibacteria bacterium]|nr:hypothetical protein [Candidatus Saccharibacteria bacterium]
MYTTTYGGYSQADYDALYNAMAGVPEGFYIWTIIASILAIVGGVLVYCLFVRNKNQPKGKFAKWLKDFLSFKIMWLEPILKIIYYIATIAIVLISFGFLGYGGSGVIMFFMTLIFGPILIRIVYEATMMFIMIWRNTRDIAENTAKKK